MHPHAMKTSAAHQQQADLGQQVPKIALYHAEETVSKVSTGQHGDFTVRRKDTGRQVRKELPGLQRTDAHHGQLDGKFTQLL